MKIKEMSFEELIDGYTIEVLRFATSAYDNAKHLINASEIYKEIMNRFDKVNPDK